MSAIVYDLRAFQSVREEARRLAPKDRELQRAAIGACRDEQEQGRSGHNVARALQVERMARQQYAGGPGPDAA